MSLAERILQGEIRAAARLMRDIDDGHRSAVEELKTLYPHTGRAFILGLTGPPGAGKSTLVDQLTAAYRSRNKRVGVVAIDPTSPFTGGAILGDRIRMNRHADDEGVFIRSLATRGCLGGLSRSTGDVVNVMDAMGMDVIIIETVGVGQDEIDIVRMAHTTVVVMVPGLGDDIQAIKAGILEIGDVFVVNKADREGADRTAAEIATMLDFTPERAWRPPIVRTVAPRGEGVGSAIDAIESHGEFLRSTGEGRHRQKRRVRARLLALLEERFRRAVEASAPQPEGFEEAVQQVLARREDPHAAATRLYGRLMGA
jgi:LAO/AO transport system kinase